MNPKLLAMARQCAEAIRADLPNVLCAPMLRIGLKDLEAAEPSGASRDDMARDLERLAWACEVAKVPPTITQRSTPAEVAAHSAALSLVADLTDAARGHLAQLEVA